MDAPGWSFDGEPAVPVTDGVSRSAWNGMASIRAIFIGEDSLKPVLLHLLTPDRGTGHKRRWSVPRDFHLPDSLKAVTHTRLRRNSSSACASRSRVEVG